MGNEAYMGKVMPSGYAIGAKIMGGLKWALLSVAGGAGTVAVAGALMPEPTGISKGVALGSAGVMVVSGFGAAAANFGQGLIAEWGESAAKAPKMP